jgi:hypothetical protein
MATKKSFPLRIDDQIFDLIRRWADDEFRSVNGQIEYLLRDALRREGRWPSSSTTTKPLTEDPDSSNTEDEGE